MSWSPDAVVIGAGLVGCAVARALADGGLRVLVCERGGELGQEASSAAAGMLAPQMESAEGLLVENEDAAAGRAMMELCVTARVRYRRFVRDLEVETGRDVHYRADGTLVLALEDAEGARLQQMAAAQSALGLNAELLSGPAARRLEPALSQAVGAALHLPDDHQVDNVALMDGAAAALRSRREVRVETNVRVEAVLSSRGKVTGVRRGGASVEVPRVVLAAGAWSGQIEGLPRALPVRPVKGQMAALKPGRPPIGRTVGGRGAYCVPRDDGRVLIGATIEEAGFDDRVTPDGVAGLLAAVRLFLPDLADAPLHSRWAGLRPGTPDSLPIIGEDSELEGLFYATGHYRNGILLAPITAEAVAALATGASPPIDLAPFAPERPALHRDR